MSKLAAALIGVGVATGIGAVVWHVRRKSIAETNRKHKEEYERFAREAERAREEFRLRGIPLPLVGDPMPTPSTTPPAPSTGPVPVPPPSTPPASGNSTPTLDLMKQLADASGKPKPETAPEPVPAPKPAPRPKKPTKQSQRHRRITRSTFDKNTGNVHQSPESLLEQARRTVPDLTLTEYTAARMVASEHYHGSVTECAAILDAELNRSPKDLDKLTAHLIPRGSYGRQGSGKRKVATTRDPALVHVEIARRVIGGELRGISKGAVIFFDPRTQLAMHRKWLAGKAKWRSCPPATVLQCWCFGYEWANKKDCTLNTAKSGGKLEWVGPIEGIDPLDLMLLRPSRGGPKHQQQYDAALSLMRKAGLA